MLQKWKKRRPGWFEQKCRGKFGILPGKNSELDQFRRLEEGESTSLLTNFDRDSLDEIAVFKDSELQKFGTNAENVKENPNKKLRRPGRPKKKRLFESSEYSGASSNIDFQNEEQNKVQRTPNQDDRPIAGILNFNGNISLLNETLRRIDLEAKDLQTDFWEGIIARKPAEDARLSAKSIEELKGINELLDRLENVVISKNLPRQRSKPTFENPFFRPIAHASRIFVKNAGLIISQLSDSKSSIKDVSKQYGVSVKSLQESMRYYLFRCGDRVEKRKRKLKLELRHNELIAEALEAYLLSRRGQYTSLKMMVDYLKIHFAETIAENMEEDFKMSTINRSRVTRILKEDLKYTWRKNCIRDVRGSNSELVAMRKIFPLLQERLTKLGYNLIYIDESAISPITISARNWQKKGELEPLIRDLRTRINVIAAHIFKGKYAFMLKQGSTRSEHVIRFFELLDVRMKDLFTDEYRKNTIFVMDNARVHTSSLVQRYLRQKDFAVLMLPAYSPELNKVEYTFRLLKNRLRKECLHGRRLESVIAETILNL